MKFYKALMMMVLALALALTSAAPGIGMQQAQAAAPTDPFTWDNANVYFLMTDRFADGNSTNNNSYGRPAADATGSNIGTFHGGDIKGLTQKLQEGYFTDLGTNAIWITAPYEQIHGFVGGGSAGDFAHYAYHGYYAQDYTAMDKNMGTVAEMREFVDLAHSQGIRVVLDVVLNHPGYVTLKDMEDFGFGSKTIGSTWKPGTGQSWHDWRSSLNIADQQAWSKWWSGGWLRASMLGNTISGYDACGGSDKTLCLSDLPDFRTEVTTNQGLAPLLKNKWTAEGTTNDPWVIPAAKKYRNDLGAAPTDYVIKWLSSWVEEFGIDGFRCDTAKHVDLNRWQQLKTEANTALQTWRTNNPAKPGAQWTDAFWMTGEVWGHGLGKSEYFNYGFDSIINFAFQNANKADLESLFSSYAAQLNTDPAYNVLSYISSHDTKLYDRNSLVQAGTALLLLPGGIQTYYGDESARPFGPTGSDSGQGTRSDMNWSSVNQDVLGHWQKLGQFRYNHPAVGAGQHKLIATAPYTFSRSYTNTAKGIDDKVVIVTGAAGSTSVTVSSVFPDGTTVKDAYTGATTIVSGGKAIFAAGSKGVILIERIGDLPLSVSASPAGGTFSSETVKVTLGVTKAANGTYTIQDGSAAPVTGSYTNGTEVMLGANVAVGGSITLSLTAASNGETVTQSYVFEKTAPPRGITVHFKKPASWGTPQVYYYETNPAIPPVTWATAPAMTAEANGWYGYLIPGVTSARVIFKDANGHQNPGASQPGFLREADGWFDGTSWYASNPDDMTAPTAPANLAVSNKTDTTVSLTWTAATDNVGVTGYQILRDGVTVRETAATSSTDSGLTASTTYEYTVVALDAAGNKSPSSSPIQVVTDPAQPGDVTIYYKSGFTTPYIHYRPENGTWTAAPGMKMQEAEIAGYYKITLNIGSASRLEAVFNNGSGTWDNNGGSNYFFNKGTSTFFPGSPYGTIVSGEPDTANKVTIVVKVPTTTASTDTLYLASSLNGWNPADPAGKLTRQADGTYTITLALAPSTKIDYKITRGTWASVEVSSNGPEIANRTYTSGSGNQAFSITVAKWKDK